MLRGFRVSASRRGGRRGRTYDGDFIPDYLDFGASEVPQGYDTRET